MVLQLLSKPLKSSLDTLMAPKIQVMQVAEWATDMRRTVDASTAA